MKKIRAIIIDDEKFCIETLQWEIEQHCPEIQVVETCQSGEEGIRAIRQWSPEVVFLDIEMPYMNAFEMLQALDVIDFDIIFTTAYDQFAIKAIKISALDYLLKPVGGAELRAAVDKLHSKQQKGASGKSIRILMEQLLANQLEVQKIALPTIEGFELVRLDQITYVAADSNYSIFHLLSGKKIIISRTLKQVETMLEENDYFFRVHQTYIVNLHHVERYNKGIGGSLQMTDDTLIPVAKSRKEFLIRRLQVF
ncbi:MAG TPA: LytTR family DNA-binding domain-containing protein [Saprospiraceae bacterium]|nr:LytTR family DNA-binding domain-containing protein [Saprospiraceae bacterium]